MMKNAISCYLKTFQLAFDLLKYAFDCWPWPCSRGADQDPEISGFKILLSPIDACFKNPDFYNHEAFVFLSFVIEMKAIYHIPGSRS